MLVNVPILHSCFDIHIGQCVKKEQRSYCTMKLIIISCRCAVFSNDAEVNTCRANDSLQTFLQEATVTFEINVGNKEKSI